MGNINIDIEGYLSNPIPLWNERLAQSLFEDKLSVLRNAIFNENEYSIAGCILKDRHVTENCLLLPCTDNKIKIVLPSNQLVPFYEEHGLSPLKFNDFVVTEIFTKVGGAIGMLRHEKPLYSFVLSILKSVQIIMSEDVETDTSYSHPDIPFSIFFSVCRDNSVISNLRVAESILHECMHLLLTLIEGHVALIEPNSKATFYSPWRDEKRPLKGVLHGLYVFRAITDFYEILLQKKVLTVESDKKYAMSRCEEIFDELHSIKNFPHTTDITEVGKFFIINLFKLK